MATMTTPDVPHRAPTARKQQKLLGALLEELGVGPGAGRAIRHQDFAAALGVSRVHWSRIVNGHQRPVSDAPPYSRWRTWADFEREARAAAAKLQNAN